MPAPMGYRFSRGIAGVTISIGAMRQEPAHSAPHLNAWSAQSQLNPFEPVLFVCINRRHDKHSVLGEERFLPLVPTPRKKAL
jgi:hypothetical protein